VLDTRIDQYVPERIWPLDPLGADDVCPRLPEMNANADTGAIAHALGTLLPSAAQLSTLDFEQSLAAMRDLGIFLGSLRRHEIEPIQVVPGLEPVLLELGRRTGMIPRETVHHYTEMNPRDARQRMYTGDPQETFMMDSVRVALRRVGNALTHCDQLSELDPHDPKFPLLLTDLADQLTAFDEAMNLVNDKLAPEFFYDVMRPYFEEIEVGGQRYLGPTAGHVPLFLVDLNLWAAGQGTPEYHSYRQSGSQYTLAHWRALEAKFTAAPPLTTKITTALASLPPDRPVPINLKDSAAALATALRVLIVFRGKHITYAKRTYPPDSHEQKGGSGGGTIALLQDILDLTRQNASLVRQLAS
jgi:monodechloroaminopyrrolnitrin synthase